MTRASGTGNVYKPSFTDRATRQRRESPYWHIRYRVHGKQQREATRVTSKAEAERILRKRLQDLEEGRPTGPQIDKVTTGDILAGLLTDYTINNRRSFKRVEDSVQHLKDFFGERAKARALDESRIGEYIAHRQKEEAANGTINRELTALKRSFRLAMISGRVVRVPFISMLKEAAPRSGFVERAQHDAVLAGMPAAVKPVLETAYITGWRVASEILTRQWKHVDFGPERWPCGCATPDGKAVNRTAASCAECGECRPGWLRLDGGETKNGQGRMFPLTPDLRSVLEAQRDLTETIEKDKGRVIPLVFHRKGKPIVSFRKAWKAACAGAGLPHLIPHDYRRTACRNLERAGVPRSTAMKLVGHVTESVYRRYTITDEAMLREGAAKLTAFHENAKTLARKVVPLASGAKAKRAK
jgi:integrase